MQYHLETRYPQLPLSPPGASCSPHRKEAHPNRCRSGHSLARSQRPAIRYHTICETTRLHRYHELRPLGSLVTSRWTQCPPQRHLRLPTVPTRVRRECSPSVDERWPSEEPIGVGRGLLRPFVSCERAGRVDRPGRDHCIPTVRARTTQKWFIRWTRRRCLRRRGRRGRRERRG